MNPSPLDAAKALRKEFERNLDGLRRLEERIRGGEESPLSLHFAMTSDAPEDLGRPKELQAFRTGAIAGKRAARAPALSSTAVLPGGMTTSRLAAPSESFLAGPAAGAGEDELAALEAEALFGGRYRLVERLAVGGMSVVYEAIDTKLQKPVVVKVILESAAQQEMESMPLALSLEHPGILRPIASGFAGGHLYLVLPLLGGASLQELLLARAVPRGALLLALRRAAAAVAYAHARGVVHRDLKPGNIQVEEDGRAIVIDWGIAMAVGGGRGAGARIIGTPYFMAPEQYRGETASPRSDVFALGTILYQILTGFHPAGEGGGLREVANRVLHEPPPPPSVLDPLIGGALDAVAVRALAKDPRERFADAGEFLEALEDALATP